MGDEQPSQVEDPILFGFVDLNLFQRKLNVIVESVLSLFVVKLI